MYLSKLEIHGFKSFAQKTTLHFDPGVTAIVGPNGCGKSNVIDAVRWVLGEQRARLLRSEKMEHVIFNGASGRRALGMAEVSLTVENTRGVLPTAYSEVTITRRLYRSGDSEYLLNGTVCRLKDILDLFMDTGMGAGAYSVIELKMIEDILSEQAADRRRLFEEAAGVTKYKLRRRQAIQKLNTTQSDLTRLTDLTEEVERTVRSLQRQAQKAARHQTLTERLTLLELALAAWDSEQLGTEYRRLDQETRGLRTEAENLSVQLTAAEAKEEEQKAALIARETARGEAQRRLNEHTETVRGLEAELRVGAERLAANRRSLERIDREETADALRHDALAEAQRTGQDNLVTQEEALTDAETTETEARARREATEQEARQTRERLEEARGTATHHEKEAAAARAELDRLVDRRDFHATELERLETEWSSLIVRLTEAVENERETTDSVSAAEKRLDASADQLRQARTEHAARQAAVAAAEQEMRDALLARDTARTEVDLLQSIVADGESDSSALRYLAETTDGPAPLTVADLIGCDRSDAVAMETALGDWTDCLVVDTEEQAQRAIAKLRAAQAGRATFVVLDRLQERPYTEHSPIPPGATPAINAARVADERLALLLRLLLQNVFFVNTMDEARALRDRYPVGRFVTRTGEWTSARGLIAGGQGKERPTTVRLGRQERLERAQQAFAEASQALTRAESQLHQARSEAERSDAEVLDATHEQIRAARDHAHAAFTRAHTERQSLDEQRERLLAHLEAVRAEQRELPNPQALQRRVEDEHERAARARTRAEEAEAAADKAEALRREVEESHSETRLALLRAQGDVERARRELERIKHEIEDVAQRAAARAEEKTHLNRSIAEGTDERETLMARLDTERDHSDALQQAAAHAEDQVLQERALITDTEKLLRSLRQKREAAMQRQNAADLRLTEIITRQDAIAERLEEEHDLSLDEAAGSLAKAAGEDGTFDAEDAREEVPALREKVRALGAVNALALESFDEEKERLDFLQQQHADLQTAEQTLLDTIEEINTTAAERFNSTFEEVREAFSGLFADLFGEDATADLVLAGDDPLEAPIDIIARPKGKKPSLIDQLSGGEKTLTAIALLFAIYLVKPSPFCILDEVDAPLDDANIGRFMDLIRSFSNSTQFILVTHNKLTMEAADRMYGITMPEPGVSRLVGVQFEEAAPDDELAVPA